MASYYENQKNLLKDEDKKIDEIIKLRQENDKMKSHLINLINDMNIIKSNNKSLFISSCKLCGKCDDVMRSINCVNNDQLYFYLCKDCYEANCEKEAKDPRKHLHNFNLSDQKLFIRSL